MKIGTKLIAAPLFTAVVALVSGTLYAVFSQHEAARAQATSLANLDQFKTLAQVQDQVSRVHADVFRTLTIISSMDEAKVKAFRADLSSQLQGVQRVVQGLPEQSAGDAQITQHVATAVPLIQQYGARADQAIDLSGMDPNVGVGAMRGAEEHHKALNLALHAIASRNEVLQGERASAARAHGQTIAAALALLMVLGTGAALLMAWRVQRRVTSELARAVKLSEAVSGGDLGISAHSEARDEIGDLVRALGRMVQGLRESMQTVRQATDQIGTAAAEIATGNTDLSQRTEQAAASLQQTAGSMETLTGTVRQTADSARTANQLAASASTVAQRGGSVVAQVVTTMNEINSSSKRIADIIGTIDGIAFQTNILALNAAVEAARAGEQGRGFAVVASEVRSLAQRSAEAAREIKALIGASVDRVEMGSKLVADAGSTMNEIVASVQRVSDIIGEITAASGEQSTGIAKVNSAVCELDGVTQQNAALVEESSAAAESLRQQAALLAQVVNRFQLAAADGTAVDAPRASPAAVAAAATVAKVKAAAARPAAAARAAAPIQRPAASASAPAPAKAAAGGGASEDWESF